jgi:hypothetical protein
MVLYPGIQLGWVLLGPRPVTYDPNESQAELRPGTFGYANVLIYNETCVVHI